MHGLGPFRDLQGIQERRKNALEGAAGAVQGGEEDQRIICLGTVIFASLSYGETEAQVKVVRKVYRWLI